MQSTAHIQATGLGRIAAVAAIVATAFGLMLTSAPLRGHAVHTAHQRMPAGGCGSSGC